MKKSRVANLLTRANYALFSANLRPRVLAVHGGLHKTGTTSVQRSLAEVGILHPCNRADFRDPSVFGSVLRGAWKRRQVVSSEHFLGEIVDMYGTAPGRFAQLTELPFKVHVTLYVRPHLEWHTSAVSQLLQQGSFKDADRYLENLFTRRYLSWYNLKMDLEASRGENTSFQIRAARDVVRDYGSLLGVSLVSDQRANLSLTPFGLVALRKLSEEGFASRDFLRKTLAGFGLESKGQYSILSQEVQVRLKQFRSDWAAVFGDQIAPDLRHQWERSYRSPALPSAEDGLSQSGLDDARRYVEKFARESD